jgi:hypothetical protein
VVLTAGARSVFAADAVTFCVSAALLMRVRMRAQVAASVHATVIGSVAAIRWRPAHPLRTPVRAPAPGAARAGPLERRRGIEAHVVSQSAGR